MEGPERSGFLFSSHLLQEQGWRVGDAASRELTLRTGDFAVQDRLPRPRRSVHRAANARAQQRHPPHHTRMRHPERIAARRAPVVPRSADTRHEHPRALPGASRPFVGEIIHPRVEFGLSDLRPGPLLPRPEVHLGQSQIDDGVGQVRPNGGDGVRQRGTTLQRRTQDVDVGRQLRRDRFGHGSGRLSDARQIGAAVAKTRYSEDRRMPQQPERAHTPAASAR